jgi:hypothetical protein
MRIIELLPEAADISVPATTKYVLFLVTAEFAGYPGPDVSLTGATTTSRQYYYS